MRLEEFDKSIFINTLISCFILVIIYQTQRRDSFFFVAYLQSIYGPNSLLLTFFPNLLSAFISFRCFELHTVTETGYSWLALKSVKISHQQSSLAGSIKNSFNLLSLWLANMQFLDKLATILSAPPSVHFPEDC